MQTANKRPTLWNIYRLRTTSPSDKWRMDQIIAKKNNNFQLIDQQKARYVYLIEMIATTTDNENLYIGALLTSTKKYSNKKCQL